MDGNQNPAENTNNNQPNPNPEVSTQISTPVNQNNPAADSSFEFNETTMMASLSYFGPLVIIPYLTKKEDPFVLFHIKQGLVLLVPYLAIWVIGGFMYWLGAILKFVELALVILSIIGIINALQKKEKALPLVGKYSSYFKI